MAGGTSGGNIITEAPGTWAARTWVDVTKVDAFGPLVDSDLATKIGANWFNQVDDTLAQINAWYNGTGEAAHIQAAEATIGTLAFDSAVVGPGSQSDANAAADDLVIGSIAATDRGITILSTGIALLAFTDSVGVIAGGISYTHASDLMTFILGSSSLQLSGTVLKPMTDNAMSLGTALLRFSAVHAMGASVYGDVNATGGLTVGGTADITGNTSIDGSLTVGDGTAAVSATLNRSVGTNTDLLFKEAGTSKWRVRHASGGNLQVARDVLGVLTDAVTVDASNAAVTLAGGLDVGDTLSVGGDTDITGALMVTGGNGLFGDASASVTAGSGAGSPSFVLDGSIGTVLFNETGTTQYALQYDGGTFAIQRYSGGVYQDAITYSLSGVTIPSNVVVGSADASSAYIGISKDEAGAGALIYYNEGTTRWKILCNSSENLLIERYNSGGTLQSTVTVSNSTGEWSFPAAIGLNGSASRLRQGSGAPSAGLGSNGDHYFRTDGTQSTCLYYKVGGSWVALAT